MKNLKFLIISALIFIADQVSKWFVTQGVIHTQISETQGSGFFEWFFGTMPIYPYVEIYMAPIFNIVMVWNRGVSFGLLSSDLNYVPHILSFLSVLISVCFGYLLMKSNHRLQQVAIAMIIGGAIGNVIDRMKFGAVIDFLDFHAFGYHWPAFNVADSAIVIGVILFAIHMFFFEKPVNSKQKTV